MKPRIGKAAMWLAMVVIASVAAQPAFAQFGRGRAARPTVNLPRGPVRDVLLQRCSTCHGIDDYAYLALDRTGWKAVIDRMKTARSGLAAGTDISPEEEEILLDWLEVRFGPDSTPFPREYVPRELAEGDYFSDDQANTLIETTCQSCHTLERVNDGTGNEESWRATLIDMIGRGARLAINDVEPLVEWLARTRGRQAL